jgi:hypothetical protein
MRMLHLSEVADRLNFSTAKTKALFENGLLPGVNAGTRRRALWLIADEVLDAWMRGEAPKPQPTARAYRCSRSESFLIHTCTGRGKVGLCGSKKRKELGVDAQEKKPAVASGQASKDGCKSIIPPKEVEVQR